MRGEKGGVGGDGAGGDILHGRQIHEFPDYYRSR